MLPHLQDIFVPLKVEPRYGNAVRILDLRVEVHIIRVRAQRWRLHREVDRSGIATLDLALERRTKTIEAVGVPREVQAAAIWVNRISADEPLFVRGFQVLPARHPRH